MCAHHVILTVTFCSIASAHDSPVITILRWPHHVVGSRATVTAQAESLLRAKTTGCWATGGCPHAAGEVHVNEDEVAALTEVSRAWYASVGEKSSTHSHVATLQTTTEDFLQMSRSDWRPWLNSTLWADRSEASAPGDASVTRTGRASSARDDRTTGRQCNLCSDNWVFILSTGRAGSTSILEALNSLPATRLRGENQVLVVCFPLQHAQANHHTPHS